MTLYKFKTASNTYIYGLDKNDNARTILVNEKIKSLISKQPALVANPLSLYDLLYCLNNYELLLKKEYSSIDEIKLDFVEEFI